MKPIIIFLIISFCHTVYSQSTFEKKYYLSTSSAANSVVQSHDGNYMITGSINSSSVPNYSNLFLLKLDQQGEKLWLQKYDTTNYGCGYEIQKTNDNGFIIVGQSYFDTINGYDISLLKVDSTGNTIWRKTYDFLKFDRGLSVKQTNDNGYVIAGECGNEYSLTSRFLCVIKTNASGDILWEKVVYNSNGGGHAIINANNGGFLVTGFTKDNDEQSFDMLLAKFDQEGELLWSKEFGGEQNELGTSIQQLYNNDIIIAGFIQDTNDTQLYKSYIVKTNNEGDSLWTRTLNYSEPSLLTSVIISADSTFVFTGRIENANNGYNVLLLKMNLNGDTIWMRKIGGENSEKYGYSVKQTSDNGYIICGFSFLFQWQTAVLVIKTDYNGIIHYTNINEPNRFKPRLYPNPCTDHFYIESKEPIICLKIFDISGNLRRSINLNPNTYKFKLEFNKNELESGFYAIDIQTDSKKLTSKIIIE